MILNRREEAYNTTERMTCPRGQNINQADQIGPKMADKSTSTRPDPHSKLNDIPRVYQDIPRHYQKTQKVGEAQSLEISTLFPKIVGIIPPLISLKLPEAKFSIHTTFLWRPLCSALWDANNLSVECVSFLNKSTSHLQSLCLSLTFPAIHIITESIEPKTRPDISGKYSWSLAQVPATWI